MRYPQKRDNALPKNYHIVFGEKRRRLPFPGEKHPNGDNTYFLFLVDSLSVSKFVQSNDIFLKIQSIWRRIFVLFATSTVSGYLCRH